MYISSVAIKVFDYSHILILQTLTKESFLIFDLIFFSPHHALFRNMDPGKNIYPNSKQFSWLIVVWFLKLLNFKKAPFFILPFFP